jgi:glutathione S-transferase
MGIPKRNATTTFIAALYRPDCRFRKHHHHWWGSTCSRKARMTLNEKGVTWESRHIDLHEFENWEPWYVKIHPNGVVPALDHDGRVVFESNAVMEYIDDTFVGPPLRPEDTWERAQMRVWLDKSEHVLHKNMHLISHNRAHAHRWIEYEKKHSRETLLEKVHNQPDLQRRRDEIHHAEEGIGEEAMEFAADRIDDQLSLMEAALSAHGWLVGDSFSLADMAVLPFVERFKVNGYDDRVNAKPHLEEWYQRIFDRPAIAAAYAFSDPDA